MTISYRTISEAEFPQAMAIRFKVFVDEQQVPPEEGRTTMTKLRSTSALLTMGSWWAPVA